MIRSPDILRVLSIEEGAARMGFSRFEFYDRLKQAEKDADPDFPRPFRYDEKSRPRLDLADIDVWIERKKAKDRARTAKPLEIVRAARARRMSADDLEGIAAA